MTVIKCYVKRCLNNKDGACNANEIILGGSNICKSCCYAKNLMKYDNKSRIQMLIENNNRKDEK